MPARRNCSRLLTVSRKSVPFRVILTFGASSSEYLHLRHRSPAFRRERYLPGVLALFTTSLVRVLQRTSRPKRRASFRPQALSASRRFAPRSSSQACFIPQPCSGPILFRGSSLSAQPCFLVENRCLLAVVAAPLLGRPSSTSTAPRLRGFAPREGA